jgi:polar amino acid transport system substrate-binding protein
MLESGAADAIASFLATPEGLKTYDFSDTLIVTGGGLFVPAPGPAPSDVASFAGKTIVTPGFGPFVSYFQKNFPNVRVVTAASYQESLDRVLSGQADAAALNIQEAQSVVSKSYAGKIAVPSTPFLSERLVLAVLKGTHKDFLTRLNAGLASIRADGTLQRIEDSWSHP